MKMLGIYDWLHSHRKAMWTSLIALTAGLAALVFRLGYSEDISDFLPLGTSDREALSVYQNISGANRLYIIFTNPDDADLTVEAMDFFVGAVRQNDKDGCLASLTASFDMEQILATRDFILANAPYFLCKTDYERMDSLLAQPGYIREQLARDKAMLMFPSSALVAPGISADPLGLFTPALERLRKADPQMNFEMYDGHIFTPDMTRAIAMADSPFGSSETEMNSGLLDILDGAIRQMEAEYPLVKAHVVGGPQIAVGNSSRIKKDSIIAISLSVVLIVLLLSFSFRYFRNILLILLSIGWGWLFAMGGLAIFRDSVSIIVIGISSVILGIAVNYPLHLIVHTAHQSDMRRTIREIMAPLVIGNVTTVGAFLALVPLQSTALRDLGLFASLLLAGTILFVLLYLPHFAKIESASDKKESRFMAALSSFSPDSSKVIVIAVVLLTVVLGLFSTRTQFDTDLTHINYMTREQRADMQYFQDLFDGDSQHTTSSLYVISRGDTFDQALDGNTCNEAVSDSLVRAGLVLSHSGVADFVVSKRRQEERLSLWREFVDRHRDELSATLLAEADACGFSGDAFSQFGTLVSGSADLSARDPEYFAPLTDLIFSRNVTSLAETGKTYVVDVLNVENRFLPDVKACFDDSFDVAGMNAALAGNLSDNFNYIGIVCSLIVFFFLWFSFGRIELALISFLPMAVSWLWILGIMAIFGIKFNIVNIILATFIFGQGDDYTIFMTEGCQWEYAYGRPMLRSYKSGILRSALIMFVGMGTLIVARHPAMRSLAELTIIGMSSVVLMATLIPPLLFRWLTVKNGSLREYPVTIASLLGVRRRDTESRVEGRYIYKGQEIYRSVRRTLRLLRAESHYVRDDGTIIRCEDHGYGETGLWLALKYPDRHIVVKIDDEDRLCVAEIAARGFADNVEYIL